MRTRPLVVDASVGTRWFLREEGTDAALALLERDDLVFQVPELWHAEVANSVWKRIHRGDENLRAAYPLIVKAIATAPVETHRAVDIVERALAIAVEADIAVYDACYAAVAERTNGTLLTADRALARRLRGVNGAMAIELFE